VNSLFQFQALEAIRKLERRVRHLMWERGGLDRSIRVWDLDK